jgi:CheY-like chemotaxis protein/anti-sigma regulatory factor (Ser/Thr protein kinase)/HPt (histidine-containing phosphotransfer) domain-containing protein
VPAPYDIPSIIYDTVQLNLLRYESKPINFELKIDGNTPLDLHGDELRIKQVLNNILSNAFKYTDQGEVELSVSAEELEDDMVMLVLRVKDTGQGMTEEQIGKLFEEYVRFNMDVNRTIVGTGLGMHITKRLVDTMEGEISVESELNKGTVFTVRLPQKRIGDIVCGEELAEKLRSSRFKSMLKLNRAQIVHEYMPYGCVLIVDDVESNLYVAKGMMLPYGLKLETVTSGFGAIEKIKNGMEYDIIFMDHMMPKMNGVEATRIIRDMGYNQPVVALTANAIAGSSDMFMKNGFDGYISKPIDIRELNAVLNRFIRDKQPPEVIEAVRREFKESKSTAFAKDDELAVAVVLDIKNALPVLTDTLNDIKSGSKDTELFTTTVHGMKSALANIGESELSGIALSLEKAGSNTDIGFISSETPAFISALEALTEKYKREDAGNPEEIHDDMDLLREKLSLLAEACEGCNKRAAKAALDELRRRKWTKDTTDTLNEIAICLLRGEFAKAVALTKKYQI